MTPEETVSAAIVDYLGMADHPSPRQLADPVRERYGDPVLAEVERIVAEAAAFPIDWDGGTTLAQGGDQVRAAMAQRYPGLSPDALQALRWYVTFIWR